MTPPSARSRARLHARHRLTRAGTPPAAHPHAQIPNIRVYPQPASLPFLPRARSERGLRARVFSQTHQRARGRGGWAAGAEGGGRMAGKHGVESWESRIGHARFGASGRTWRRLRAAHHASHTPAPATPPVKAPTVPEQSQSVGIIRPQPPASVMRAIRPHTPRIGDRRAAGVSGVVSYRAPLTYVGSSVDSRRARQNPPSGALLGS